MRVRCPQCKRRSSVKQRKPGLHAMKCRNCGQALQLTIPADPDELLSVALVPEKSVTTRPRQNSQEPSGGGKPSFEKPKQPDATREIATGVFEQIAPTINNQLPPGCQADKGLCIALLRSLIDDGIGPQRLVASFAEKFHEDVLAYVDQPRMYIAAEANRIFEEIKPQLSASLPAGYSLNIATCCGLLTTLLTADNSDLPIGFSFLDRPRLANISPDSLIREFIQRVEENPIQYILKDPKPSHIASNAPMSMSRQELR